MRLTPNFELNEFTLSQTAVRNGIDNTPNAQALANLIRTAEILEEVRNLFGRPIRISSGFRCQALNDRVSKAKNSQHIYGQAADFTVSGVSLDDIMESIMASDLPYDQLIREFNAWIHISIPKFNEKPRKEALIIDKNGTRAYA